LSEESTSSEQESSASEESTSEDSKYSSSEALSSSDSKHSNPEESSSSLNKSSNSEKLSVSDSESSSSEESPASESEPSKSQEANLPEIEDLSNDDLIEDNNIEDVVIILKKQASLFERQPWIKDVIAGTVLGMIAIGLITASIATVGAALPAAGITLGTLGVIGGAIGGAFGLSGLAAVWVGLTTLAVSIVAGFSAFSAVFFANTDSCCKVEEEPAKEERLIIKPAQASQTKMNKPVVVLPQPRYSPRLLADNDFMNEKDVNMLKAERKSLRNY
jgi:hypothetical protein